MRISKRLYFLLLTCCLSCLIFSCNDTDRKNDSTNNNSTVQNSEVDKFLDLFEVIPSDTFEIESTDMIVDSIPFAFKGKIIEPQFYKYIDDELTESAKPNGYDLFACYQKRIDKDKSLLILRVPSEYWESMIKLYVFDHKLQKTIAKVEAAENWGDGGDTYLLTSYLVPRNDNYELISFTNYCWTKRRKYGKI